MNATLVLEASKSTGTVRMAVDLRVNLAAILAVLSRLF